MRRIPYNSSIGNRQQMKQVVFLCGARDFHAMDWYRESLRVIERPKPAILTDLISSEGFSKLINDRDLVYRLFLLDYFLPHKESTFSRIWRRLLKIIFFPVQVILVRRLNRKLSHPIFYAHSMYYIWLAWASQVHYAATPQGSDILIKPNISKIFFLLSKFSLRSAVCITVDSQQMVEGVYRLSGKKALLIQNGIDLKSIGEIKDRSPNWGEKRLKITSFRGFDKNYQIEKILESRKCTNEIQDHAVTFAFPFVEYAYLSLLKTELINNDEIVGRLSREELYELFSNSFLAVSIPVSDSSPRSVYEAIFCGTIVAVTWNSYIVDLPTCMQRRLIIVDLNNKNWLLESVKLARILIQEPFLPSPEALECFDQSRAFLRVHSLMAGHKF
jgi:hypothetical protein